MRRLTALAMTVLFVIGYIDGASPARSASDPAKSTVILASLGDSITTAAGTCGPYFRCLDHSWATGTKVYSVYQRLQAANPNVNVQPLNLAEPGAGAAYLYVEAQAAVAQKADFITILIGANDACTWPMTSTDQFRGEIDYALEVLKQRRPRPRIEIVSIPDVVQLWNIAHSHPLALLIWQLKECPSLMTNATSTAAADVRRRASVGRRIRAYNYQLASACKEYGDRCHWDRGRAHRVKFTLELVGLDYFHPSIRGQQELAEATLPSGWMNK